MCNCGGEQSKHIFAIDTTKYRKMVELQLQIARESCSQSLGMNILAVKTKAGKTVVVEAVAQNSCSALGGLEVRYFPVI